MVHLDVFRQLTKPVGVVVGVAKGGVARVAETTTDYARVVAVVNDKVVGSAAGLAFGVGGEEGFLLLPGESVAVLGLAALAELSALGCFEPGLL